MPNTKTATLTLRIDPELKGALKSAAEREHRSIANMVEVMIKRQCGMLAPANELTNTVATEQKNNITNQA